MREHTPDTVLVERLRSGDDSALAELANRYTSKIYQLAFRYVKNREDAEEVTQDVLMKVFAKIEMFRGDSALSSWIYRITFNTAMSRLRRGRLTRAVETTELPIGSPAASTSTFREISDCRPDAGRSWRRISNGSSGIWMVRQGRDSRTSTSPPSRA